MALEQGLQSIIAHFKIAGKIDKISSHGNGLINKTYRLFNTVKSEPDYLLQCINHNVFDDIAGLMSNIEKVTSYQVNQIIDHKDKVISLIPIETKSNKLFLHYNEQYWRIFVFFDQLKSYDNASNNKQVYEGAKAFGSFVKGMIHFPAAELHIVIPDFHNLKSRLNQLDQAKSSADLKRLSKSTDLLEDVQKQCSRLFKMIALVDLKKFPVRVTHNDTKFNNVLFDSSDEGACVIDLDTVMPGIIHFDFGDGLRTGAVQCKEDEADLASIYIQEDVLKAYTIGFLAPLQNLLTTLEIQFLPLAAPYMSLIMAVRFLTDFLNNDKYYQCHYEDQNFNRARCQLKLCDLFYEKRELVTDIITEALTK